MKLKPFFHISYTRKNVIKWITFVDTKIAQHRVMFSINWPATFWAIIIKRYFSHENYFIRLLDRVKLIICVCYPTQWKIVRSLSSLVKCFLQVFFFVEITINFLPFFNLNHSEYSVRFNLTYLFYRLQRDRGGIRVLVFARSYMRGLSCWSIPVILNIFIRVTSKFLKFYVGRKSKCNFPEIIFFLAI